MKKLSTILAFPIALLLSGCLGTMITGTERVVNIITPTGDQIKVEVYTANGVRDVTAPISMIVPASKSSLTITVKDPCYKETTTFASSKINIVSLFDFLFGAIGTTGASVDAGNGSFWTYDSNVMVVPQPNNNCRTK